jgi:alpha/beta superfamily hydrolase
VLPSASALRRHDAEQGRAHAGARLPGPARHDGEVQLPRRRRVGASAGGHDDGAGESEDAAVVADWASAETGAARLWSLGFSFGGFVAYRLATARGAAALITVAPPVQRFDFTRLPVPACPWLVAQGDADELVDHERVLAWTRALDPAPVVRILAGAEHFFHGRLTELRSLLGEWLAARAAENP